MLADVRRMRIDGRPIPREHLRSVQPIRGELSVTRRRDPWRDAWVPIAVLSPQVPGEVPALDQVRIARWTGSDMLLVGIEHVGRLRQLRPVLQAWWVQLVINQAQPSTPLAM